LKYAGLINRMALMALASTSVHLSLSHLPHRLPSLRLLQRLRFIALGLRFAAAASRPLRQLDFMPSPHRFCGELLPLFSLGRAPPLIFGPP
jgi:hypothetical protein